MDKQMIEEMANDIAQASFHATQECLGTECEDCRHWIGFAREGCKYCYTAEYLYEAGYRKMGQGRFDPIEEYKKGFKDGVLAMQVQMYNIAKEITEGM